MPGQELKAYSCGATLLGELAHLISHKNATAYFTTGYAVSHTKVLKPFPLALGSPFSLRQYASI